MNLVEVVDSTTKDNETLLVPCFCGARSISRRILSPGCSVMVAPLLWEQVESFKSNILDQILKKVLGSYSKLFLGICIIGSSPINSNELSPSW